MSYHPSLLSSQTRENVIARTQTTTYKLTNGESLVVEIQALQMVLGGNPPAALKERCEHRIDEITRKLSELTEAEALHLARGVFAAMLELAIKGESQAAT